jgi:hypothetical protein
MFAVWSALLPRRVTESRSCCLSGPRWETGTSAECRSTASTKIPLAWCRYWPLPTPGSPATRICPLMSEGVASLRPGPRRPPARISVQTSTYPSCSSRDTSATTTGLDRAITEFSAGYADQDSRDYEAFVKAVSDGRLEAVHGL